MAKDISNNGASHLKPVATMPLSDGMRQFKKRIRYLSSHRPELTRKYPDQWVGLACNGTLIAGTTIRDVLAKVEAQGLDKEGLAVKLMASEPRRMIL